MKLKNLFQRNWMSLMIFLKMWLNGIGFLNEIKWLQWM